MAAKRIADLVNNPGCRAKGCTLEIFLNLCYEGKNDVGKNNPGSQSAESVNPGDVPRAVERAAAGSRS
jgi:hypothetical protein